MAARDIIVIGASAGGVEALIQLVGTLPASFRGTLFVVTHVPAHFPSMLPAILARSGALSVTHALDGGEIRPGHIYVAPPDQHLLLEAGATRLYHGPKENHARPAIDPLFRTAAAEYGPRVVGVVLSGALYDGTAGLITIKRNGGIAIVQDPEEARYGSMPRSAISRDHPDYILPLSEIAATLVRLADAEYSEREARRADVKSA